MSKLLERRPHACRTFRGSYGTLRLENFLESSGYCSHAEAQTYAANIIDHIDFDMPHLVDRIVVRLKQCLHQEAVDIDDFNSFVNLGLHGPMKCNSRHISVLRFSAQEKALHPHKIIDLLLDAPDAAKWRDQIDLANTYRLEVPNTQSAPESNQP